MSAATVPSELSWVRGFFSGRNHLHWGDIENQVAPVRVLSHVMPWLKKLAEPGYGGPVVLPLYGQDDQITWYAMADGDRFFAQMVDEVTGFVGPSYSDFRGEWANLCLDDAPERALAERFGTRVIKFGAAKD